jgi:hypothetical protein
LATDADPGFLDRLQSAAGQYLRENSLLSAEHPAYQQSRFLSSLPPEMPPSQKVGLLFDAIDAGRVPDWSGDVFGPSNVMGAVSKTARIANPLIVQHNTRSGALERYDKMGGIPMPSMAVAKAEQPLTTKFGEISLLGPPEMAKPSARNPVYSSDAYTVRAPRPEIVPSKSAIKKVQDVYEIDSYEAKELLDVIYKDEWGSVSDSYALARKFMDENKIPYDPKSVRRSFYDWENYSDNPAARAQDRASGLTRLQVAQNWLDDQRRQIADLNLDLKEVFFDGFTPSGNRRYKAATLENMVRAMKKEKGAGMEGLSGMGQDRAAVAPKFRSLQDVKNNRDRIVDKEQFDASKKSVGGAYEDLGSALRDVVELVDGSNNYNSAEGLLTDLLTGQYNRGDYWGKRFVPHIGDDILDQAKKVRADLRNMPTEYFEIKPERGVQLSEFKGAIIPEDAPKSVERILQNAGVQKILKYGSEEERVSLFRKFPELYFALGGAAYLGASQNQSRPKSLLEQ